MAKRGRPINWEKAYKTYRKTVDYYTKTFGTYKNDWYMEDFHQFKERVMSQRDIKKNWTVAKTTSYFAQKASLNGVTINQINALRKAGAEVGQDLRFTEAVPIFASAQDEDLSDVKDLVEDNGLYDGTFESLGNAVRNGELTISEMYKFLASQGITDTNERRDILSQNVSGSA